MKKHKMSMTSRQLDFIRIFLWFQSSDKKILLKPSFWPYLAIRSFNKAKLVVIHQIQNINSDGTSPRFIKSFRQVTILSDVSTETYSNSDNFGSSNARVSERDFWYSLQGLFFRYNWRNWLTRTADFIRGRSTALLFNIRKLVWSV